MVTESGKDQPRETRERIKEQLKRAAMLWDDTRASQDVGPVLGMDVAIFASTPQSQDQAYLSAEKAAVMARIIAATELLSSTSAFKKYLTDIASIEYDLGFPASFAFPHWWVDLAEDRLGYFDPEKIHETEVKLLSADLASTCLSLIGHHGIFIPEREEAEMTNFECALAARSLFRKKDEERLLTINDVRVLEELYIPGGFGLLQLKLGSIKRGIEWADQFFEFYKDSQFVEAAETVRPLMNYLVNPEAFRGTLY